jgi:hypothetical protein
LLAAPVGIARPSTAASPEPSVLAGRCMPKPVVPRDCGTSPVLHDRPNGEAPATWAGWCGDAGRAAASKAHSGATPRSQTSSTCRSQPSSPTQGPSSPKLAVSDRLQATVLAYKSGLITPGQD